MLAKGLKREKEHKLEVGFACCPSSAGPHEAGKVQAALGLSGMLVKVGAQAGRKFIRSHLPGFSKSRAGMFGAVFSLPFIRSLLGQM